MTNSPRYFNQVKHNDMKVVGWRPLDGLTVNHYWDGTWTLCQHLGAYHGAKAERDRELPECVHCSRLVQWYERHYSARIEEEKENV